MRACRKGESGGALAWWVRSGGERAVGGAGCGTSWPRYGFPCCWMVGGGLPAGAGRWFLGLPRGKRRERGWDVLAALGGGLPRWCGMASASRAAAERNAAEGGVLVLVAAAGCCDCIVQ